MTARSVPFSPNAQPRRALTLLAGASVLLALSGCIIVPVPIGIPISTFSSGPIAAKDFRKPPPGPAGDVVREVNAFRAANSLPPLSWNDRLAAAASSHARDLDESGTFGHVGSRGSTLLGRLSAAGYSECFTAENVARGHPNAARVVAGWEGSPGHRRAMLRTKAREAGAAMSNIRGRPVWVLDLGAGCF